ncbi:hypothetical protein CDO46_26940 [Pigmentiphaga sp. NML030171]|uniref:glycosyltransferase n=1 Tax=Pigmentiphaga sp. NML030171 TaxID=2008676 RepID=UPI000B41A474|nr:glycosyltransferase [Pigmentiphaga sp. NML030171]OVZ58151.1 hypothetical protein CDO46_26940 [Pigmentiphaga sp. NML030171]
MIVFIRSHVPQLDGRMRKYRQALAEAGMRTVALGWLRGESIPNVDEANDAFYRRPAPLGGGWRNVLNLVLWNGFVLRWLWHNRRDIDLVHGVDFDSCLPAYVFSRLRRVPFVFDLYDKYTETRGMAGPVAAVIDTLESWVASKADLVLLADASRYEQHGLRPSSRIRVLENVPVSGHDLSYRAVQPQVPIRIGYFGVLEERNRGLEDLIAACTRSADKVELHLAGYGPVAPLAREAARQHENVTFHGAMDVAAGLSLMSSMDVVAGFYYLTVPNHRFAAPNKYYEHLLLGRPLLTTKGTPPGDKVGQYETGWALDEGEAPILQWLADVGPAEIERRGRNARMKWDTEYENYYEENYAGFYAEYVRGRIAARRNDRVK